VKTNLRSGHAESTEAPTYTLYTSTTRALVSFKTLVADTVLSESNVMSNRRRAVYRYACRTSRRFSQRSKTVENYSGCTERLWKLCDGFPRVGPRHRNAVGTNRIDFAGPEVKAEKPSAVRKPPNEHAAVRYVRVPSGEQNRAKSFDDFYTLSLLLLFTRAGITLLCCVGRAEKARRLRSITPWPLSRARVAVKKQTKISKYSPNYSPPSIASLAATSKLSRVTV